jgi:NADH dehydrogenase FAD-containing subunit
LPKNLSQNPPQQELNSRKGAVCIVGSGYMGVEWATQLAYHFKDLRIVLTDFMPRCLATLNEDAADYCEKYMQKVGIKTVYGVKYQDSPEFWRKTGLERKADATYICLGVKSSSYFLQTANQIGAQQQQKIQQAQQQIQQSSSAQSSVLSEKGPSGGGWILHNKFLQVKKRDGTLWAPKGNIFAIGDCNYSAVGDAPNFEVAPIPKLIFPAQEQACHVVKSIKALDAKLFPDQNIRARCMGTCLPSIFPKRKNLASMFWPFNAGTFNISLGKQDGILIMGTTEKKNSGSVIWKGKLTQKHKQWVESSRMEGIMDGLREGDNFGFNLVHNWSLNLFGRGPLMGS